MAAVGASEPVAGPLAGTIFSRMTHTTTSGAHYVVGDIGTVLALPTLVIVRSAVATSRSISLSESSVEQRQLSQLVPPQVVLALRHVHSLLDHLIDLGHGFLDGLRVHGSDVGMQWLVLARQRLAVLATDLALLDGAFAADDDLGTRLFLHRFESVASWPNEEADKVDLRVVILRNHHFVVHLDLRRLVVRRRLVVVVDGHELLDALVTCLLQLSPLPVLPSVHALAVRRIDGLGRRRPVFWVWRNSEISHSQASRCILDF